MSRRETVVPAFVIPLGGVALGLVAVAVASGGTGSRAWLAVPILAAGAAAALLPFRYGLAAAVVLAGFNGFMLDFVGDRATYWNEIFAGLVVLRSLVIRRPSRAEIVAGVVVAAVFAGYLASGTSLKADVWGAKVLLLSAVVGWAVARLGPGARAWRSVFYGLAIVVPANLVLEIWQRIKGPTALTELGLVYGERVREITSGGALRAFGGFTSAAPLSYALAITLAVWLGFALGSPSERRLALATAWLPPAAGAGVYLSVDRTAILALLLAVLVVGATSRRAVLVPAAAVGAVVVVLISTLPPTAPFRHQLGSGAKARSMLWGLYLADFRAFGEGPASAGSAYDKVEPPHWRAPLRIPARWVVSYERILLRGDQAPVFGTYLPHRPPLTMAGGVRSIDTVSRLRVFTADGRRLANLTVPSARRVPIAVRIPPSGEPETIFRVTVDSPRPEPEIDLRHVRVRGLPPPRTAAERIWKRWFDRTPAALQSEGPGLVDNLYVSWLWQYGVVGAAFCAVWLGVLLRPLFRRTQTPAMLSAALVGVFLVVAAAVVNVWEEAPTDLLAALIFAHAFAARRPMAAERARAPRAAAENAPARRSRLGL